MVVVFGGGEREGPLLLLLRLCGGSLALWHQGGDLVGNFVQLGLDLVQNGVNLSLVVNVDLEQKSMIFLHCFTRFK